jgi:hypothetical protein
MLVLTEDAILNCAHILGLVNLSPSQDLVTVAKRRILADPDPENRPIAGCPNINVGIKPCTQTLWVDKGYSEFVRIGGKRICLASLQGITDGTPPRSVKYVVRTAGQEFVSEAE